MQSQNQQEPQGLTLTDFIKVIKIRIWWIILVFSSIVTTAVLYTFLQEKTYKSVATIRVEKPESEVAVWQSQSSGNYDPFFIKEQFEIIPSRKILLPVIDELKLVSIFGQLFSYPFEAEDIYKILANDLLDMESRSGTSLIDIGVVVPKRPVLAAEIANKIAEIYEKDRKNFAISGQTEGINKLKEELNKQEEIVSTERDKVEKLRQDLNIAGFDINTQSVQLEIENLRQIERTLTSLRVDAIARKTRWERFKEVPVSARMNLINSELISDPTLQNLMQAYLMSDQQYVRMKGQFGEAHPQYISSQANLKKIREQLTSLLDGYEKSLEIAYSESQSRVFALEEQLDTARLKQIETASSKMRLFEEAVEKLRDEENLQKAFRLNLRQREIDFQVPKRTVEILNRAIPPDRAYRPSWLINIGLSIVLGSIFSIGFAFLREFSDTSFRSVEDIERLLNLPILGVVAKKRVFVGPNNFNSFEAEPYRVVQTNLDLASGGMRNRIITVQSAGPGEGKSTTLYNIAAVMAQTGQKVIIVDSDLRRPSQHRLMETSRKKGLKNLLLGENTLEEATQKTAINNLDFIPSGEAENFHLSILHLKQLDEILVTLGEKYDRILMDSPPVIGISDASVLASKADGVVFVIQHRSNPQSMTIRARQIINNVDGKIFGVVLNQVPDSGGEDYNYYTSNYYYYSQGRENLSDYRFKRSSRRSNQPEQPGQEFEEEQFEFEEDTTV